MLASRLKAAVAIGLLLIGSAYVVYLAVSIGAGDLLSVRARWEQGNWSKPNGVKPAEADLVRVRAAYQRALAWRPYDGHLHSALGYGYSVQAARFTTTVESRHSALLHALASFRAAVESRPMHQYAWMGVAYTLLQLNEVGAELWQAYDWAFQYGWKDHLIRPQLAEICFSLWYLAGHERQVQMDQMIASLSPAQRNALLDIAISHGRYHLLTTR